MRRGAIAAAMVLAGGLGIAASDGKTGDIIDPIYDLQVTAVDTVTLTLQWSAPSCQNMYGAYGDGPNGDGLFPANSYEIRYSTSPISVSDFDTLPTPEAGLPTPGEAGRLETCGISSLSQGKKYWFVLRATFGSVADYSYVATASTLTDGAAPGALAPLSAEALNDQEVRLAWTATGDDGGSGRAAAYELRYSSAGPIVTTTDFDHATPIEGLPYPDVAGATEKMTTAGFAPLTTYWFAIRAVDEVGNRGALAPASTTTGAPPPPSDGHGRSCGASTSGAALGLALLAAAAATSVRRTATN